MQVELVHKAIGSADRLVAIVSALTVTLEHHNQDGVLLQRWIFEHPRQDEPKVTGEVLLDWEQRAADTPLPTSLTVAWCSAHQCHPERCYRKHYPTAHAADRV